VEVKHNWRRVSQSFKHLYALSLNSNEIRQVHRLIPNKPFAFTKSQEFLLACKEGNLEELSLFIQKDKWVVHSFDRTGSTGLHWASIRAHLEVLSVLLKQGVFVDSRDSLGRTPLLQAVQCNSLDVVRLLLCYKANPFIGSKAGIRPLKLAKSVMLRRLLQKASLLHLLLKYVPKRNRGEVWDKEGLKYFNSNETEVLSLF
jgi:ankyrin repeat protein